MELVVKPGDNALARPEKFSHLITVRYDIIMTALTPIVHSAGTVGNDAICMTERVMNPDDPESMPEDIPCLTGNSLRHSLREGLVRLTLRFLDMDLGSLPLVAQHFLLSGGSLGKQAATLDVKAFRELLELFPYVGLFGGGLGSALLPGKLQIGFGLLMCEQNRWRIERLSGKYILAHLDSVRPAQEHRTRMQGTRHEIQRTALARHMLPAHESILETGDGDEKSTQMIYGFEAIPAGSRFFWQPGGTLMTPLEHSALICALIGMASNGLVGAKTGTGHGRVQMRSVGERGDTRPLVEALAAVETEAVARDIAERMAGGYVQHVQAHAGALRDWLTGLK